MNNKRERQFYAAASVVVIILGLLSRRVSDYIPNFIDSYLGDALWALMIYFITRTLFINYPIKKNARAAVLFCFIIEFSQIYHAPWIDSVRRTILGGLVLGYGFLWSDLCAYLLGIGFGVLVDKLRGSKYSKKAAILAISLAAMLIIVGCFGNPGRVLRSKSFSEVGLYSLLNNKKTLWDLGYKQEDFTKADPSYGDFEYNALFTGEALKEVEDALKTPSKSYYFFPDDIESSRFGGLYIIDISTSEDQGIVLITKDLEEEYKGRFIAYKYRGKVNPTAKWMIYYNKELGQTLKALRVKGDK